jgi:hypothetical protein
MKLLRVSSKNISIVKNRLIFTAIITNLGLNTSPAELSFYYQSVFLNNWMRISHNLYLSPILY